MQKQAQSKKSDASRREFLKSAGTVAAGAAIVGLTACGDKNATGPGSLPKAYAAGSDEIKVALIGCGGRGKGAAANACASSEGVKLVCVADAFKDKAEKAATELKKQAAGDPPKVIFGLEAYKEVMALPEVNYCILATPPGFRSQHIKAAIGAGKNIFAEKPTAVDGPTVRECMEAFELATTKKIGIGCGTQRRHQFKYLETIKRIQAGEVGKITSGRVYWNHGELWNLERTPEMTDLEWQLRNWMYFTWLSGDHIVEQHVHNIDVANWVLGAHPKRCLSLGGRQARVDPKFGNIYDHFATEFEYPNNVFVTSFCRQQDGTDADVGEWFYGDKGRVAAGLIMVGDDKKWQWSATDEDEKGGPYVQEHRDLIASIREGKPINELKTITEACIGGIMGRISAYTGKYVTYKQVLVSQEKLMPDNLSLDMKLPVAPVAIPGKTKVL